MFGTTPHQLNHAWCEAFNAGDLPAMMATYEADAVLVPGPDAEPVRGHDAIRASLGGFLELGGTLSFTPRHWIEQRDLVFSSITFELAGGSVPLAGVTSEVLRRQADGSLKYVIDHPFGGSS